ncbi:hypothetical protein [Rhodanobacter caeni]|uniref:DUF3618 domain-containing protein n=1 Tax=Rhodanobacter caeni TaxID=657654 RepID=A0ABP3EDK5_9GAMM
MSAQPVPTIEQRRALAAYLEARREAIHAAERCAPTHHAETPETLSSWGMVKDMARTAWLQVRDEFCEAWREEQPAFLAAALIWSMVLGIGLVMLAVRQGWVS